MPICDITVSSGELYKHAYKLCYNSRNILFNTRGKIKLVRRFQRTSGYITNYLGNTILSSVLLILRKKWLQFYACQFLMRSKYCRKWVFFTGKFFFLEKNGRHIIRILLSKSLNPLIKNERKTIAFFIIIYITNFQKNH